jgi:hypothetical protein
MIFEGRVDAHERSRGYRAVHAGRPAYEIVLPGGFLTSSVILPNKIAFNDGYAILRGRYSLKYGEDLNGTLTRKIRPPAVFTHSKCCKHALQSMPPVHLSGILGHFVNISLTNSWQLLNYAMLRIVIIFR